MKKNVLLSALIVLCCSCDSGDILEKDIAVKESGKVVKLTAAVSGISHWSGSYNVALAAFSEGNKFAITQRAIPESTPDGQQIAVTLDNLSAEVNTVELALTDKLRKRILTLVSLDMDDFNTEGDTIRMDLGTLPLDQIGCIRQGIFNVACIQCHGANGHAAANLNLTKDMPAKGMLNQILVDGGASVLHYNHTEVLSSHFKNNFEEVKQLLYDWISADE